MSQYYEDDELGGYDEEIVPVEGDYDDDDDLGYDEYIDDDDIEGEDDLIGDDEDLIGDEVDDLLDALTEGEVGARRRRRSRSRYLRRRSRPRSRRRFIRRRRSRPRRKLSLKKVRASQARTYPLGLGTTALGASATAVITVNPQLPFKLMKLATPSTNVQIDNIQIGTVSQFVAAGGIPAEVFAPNSVGVGLKGDTAVPGVQIQITVTDTSAAANTFTGAFFGLVAQ